MFATQFYRFRVGKAVIGAIINSEWLNPHTDRTGNENFWEVFLVFSFCRLRTLSHRVGKNEPPLGHILFSNLSDKISSSSLFAFF